MTRSATARFRSFALTGALLVLAPLAGGCVGLDAGSRYPSYNSSKVGKLLESPENQPDPSLTLGEFKVRDKACEGVDTHTVSSSLSHDDFTRFLQSQGVSGVDVKARNDLFWFEFPGTKPKKGDVVRLRLAVLDDPNKAADELHRALLQHGPGWWGLRRGNLSILAPRASTGEAIAFALKYKLVCWGQFQQAGVDDVYVVPGPYSEL